MRLIDADAAIDFIDAGHLCNPNEPRWSDNEVVNFLKSRPSAEPKLGELASNLHQSIKFDAVPVIRCKDCKNFVIEEDETYCIDMAGQCDENGFCAWAERKEE